MLTVHISLPPNSDIGKAKLELQRAVEESLPGAKVEDLYSREELFGGPRRALSAGLRLDNNALFQPAHSLLRDTADEV